VLSCDGSHAPTYYISLCIFRRIVEDAIYSGVLGASERASEQATLELLLHKSAAFYHRQLGLHLDDGLPFLA